MIPFVLHMKLILTKNVRDAIQMVIPGSRELMCVVMMDKPSRKESSIRIQIAVKFVFLGGGQPIGSQDVVMKVMHILLGQITLRMGA
jgi:hypothetical protein